MRYFNFRAAGLSAALFGAAMFAPPALANELRVVMESRLGNLDPIMSASHQTRDHGYLIYDTLFGLDADQKVQPQMVDSYTVSDDGLVYTFTLRDGLAWTDGTPVTTEDVIASIKRWGQRDRMGIALMSITDSLEAKDAKTFVLTLTSPSGVVLEAFAKPSGVPLFIMPKEAAATPFTEQITDYRGSGPFRFLPEAYEPGVKSVYVKNEAYVPRSEPPSWFAGAKIAKVDRIERIEMPDPLTAVNALNSGEIDYLQTIPPDLLPLVQTDVIKTDKLDQLGYQISIRMNFLQPPFDNKLVRQAALAALGQEEIMQAQFGDPESYQICGAAFGCGLPYESDVMAEEVVKPDPEKAKALLKEAGYNGEPVVIFHVSDISTMSALAPTIAQQLREAGFNVELATTDFMTMLSRRANQGPTSEGGWSIFVTSWHNTEIEDPLRNYMITAEGREGYAGWADVPEIGEKIHDFLLASDYDARKKIADDIQGVVYDEVVFVPIGGFARVTGYSSKVEGVLPAPANIFWNISKSEN
ncbi:ABC transporter substrate-binding protein [Paenirhodobacter populi]|uniref:ABC transporter substrate-binding protein n=1 Tax=Paenirhodobacter populi TaxID=2306993 RepID=A0A443JC42_9RHOB|nr:ABC transporter substrate-binding protein [Sinirhodobacter populi]RWR18105.1 ABC transporter substrate-binding protein [Sinirhodobacter populi]